ncbi:hypothetical protein ANCDUO_00789 [Ancylostoma duodenale]|uniref:Cyclin N-terminal domain-containing protein n=1 Tax=Ancylostoma duodenale TaxID=51022 RepID=A0A0C2HB62_9BILA|nr:hypothetical protein ANCDUO_00789 [Ancylostoma duodenale]
MTTLAEKRSLALAKAQAFVRTRKTEAAPGKNSENGGEKSEAAAEDNNPIKPSSFGLRPHFSTVNINCDKWYQTMDEKARLALQDPPSLADGMDRETEKHTVMACLLLASKIEEEPRRTRDVYNVFYRLEQLHKLRESGRLVNEAIFISRIIDRI